MILDRSLCSFPEFMSMQPSGKLRESGIVPAQTQIEREVDPDDAMTVSIPSLGIDILLAPDDTVERVILFLFVYRAHEPIEPYTGEFWPGLCPSSTPTDVLRVMGEPTKQYPPGWEKRGGPWFHYYFGLGCPIQFDPILRFRLVAFMTHSHPSSSYPPS